MALSKQHTEALRRAHLALFSAVRDLLQQEMRRGEPGCASTRRAPPGDDADQVSESIGIGRDVVMPGSRHVRNEQVALADLVEQQWRRLQALPEYSRLGESMRGLLKPATATGPELLARYVRRSLATVLRKTPSSVEIDEDVIDPGLNAVFRYINEGAIAVAGCAPLIYYKGEHEEFEVEGALAIRRISHQELDAFGQLEAPLSSSYRSSDILDSTRWVISWRGDAYPRGEPPLLVAAGDLAVAMVAFKPGQFVMPAAMELPIGWWPDAGVVTLAPPPGAPVYYSPVVAQPYELRAEEVGQLEGFWSAFRHVQNPRFRLAAERLWRGVIAGDLADKILDLVIGLEAIYDVGGQELGFRLGCRAAAALGKTPDEREHVFDQVKKAYKSRSDVVHGRKRPPSADACTSAQRILRQSIQLWVRHKSGMENPDSLDTRLVRGQ